MDFLEINIKKFDFGGEEKKSKLKDIQTILKVDGKEPRILNFVSNEKNSLKIPLKIKNQNINLKFYKTNSDFCYGSISFKSESFIKNPIYKFPKEIW